MNLNGFIKKALWLAVAISCYQIESTVKTFVNDSSRNFVVRVYDNDNNIICTKLVPGAIQELFIPGKIIDKIIIQDEKQNKKAFGSMTRNILRKETSKINENMTFIIHQDGSIKMYTGLTAKDETLQKIDTTYTETGKLPTIDMAIHTTKADQLGTMQNVSYTIKYSKTFFETIESFFS